MIHVYWGDDQTTLFHSFEGTWTVEDYDRAVDSLIDLLRDRESAVHVIADFRRSPATPHDLLRAMLRPAYRTVPNLGHIVAVAPDFHTRLRLGILRRFVPPLRHMRIVATPEEADQALSHAWLN
jgi:hypothetical protein